VHVFAMDAGWLITAMRCSGRVATGVVFGSLELGVNVLATKARTSITSKSRTKKTQPKKSWRFD
jgi:hypothetical protein